MPTGCMAGGRPCPCHIQVAGTEWLSDPGHPHAGTCTAEPPSLSLSPFPRASSSCRSKSKAAYGCSLLCHSIIILGPTNTFSTRGIQLCQYLTSESLCYVFTFERLCFKALQMCISFLSRQAPDAQKHWMLRIYLCKLKYKIM